MAFIVVTERFGARLDPASRRHVAGFLSRSVGSLSMGTCCIDIFLMRVAAECHKQKQLYMRATVKFHFAR